MHSYVLGIRPADTKYKKMLTLYHQCTDAGVSLPPEVRDFFNNEPPDPTGVVIRLPASPGPGAVKEYHEDMLEGFEIDITKLPKDVTIIRFVNSY